MPKRKWGKVKFLVERPNGFSLAIEVVGRNRWALEMLIAAGQRCCSPIEAPGPRWSGYVQMLRQLGVSIETICENQGGDFAGSHARYVLASKVSRDTEAPS